MVAGRRRRQKAHWAGGCVSLITQAFLVEKYGLRLTMDQLGEALGMAKQTIFNKIAKSEFEVPTYMDAGKRYADFRDVASYLDLCRERAATPA